MTCPRTGALPETPPEELGLDPEPIRAAIEQIRSHEEASGDGHPMYAGAVGLMGHDGHVVARDASGWALRWADATTELPRGDWVPMREDTIFDLASVSKLFTSLAVVQLIEEGRLALDTRVATVVPEFGVADKDAVTVRHLLTHTSGLTAWLPLWSGHPDPASRIAAVLAQPLENPSGSTYRYSDLNLLVLGVLVERLRGEPLDVLGLDVGDT